MIHGSCLCGGVRFEVERAAGPFELCHCRRCRKTSGSSHAAMIGVETKDFRLVQGAELIRTYVAPILECPPPFRASFCSRCGSPVPLPEPGRPRFEIPAGLLDDDPGLRPDKHICVDLRAPWCEIIDALPQLTKAQLRAARGARG